MDRVQRKQAVADLLRDQAARVAAQHGLDPDRVRRVYHRILRQCGYEPVADEVGEDGQKSGLHVGPSFDDALNHLPPTNALALFESEDLTRLHQRESATRYLFDDGPFYTLEELGDLAESFAEYLEDNRSHLVGTGHPATSFGKLWRVATWPRLELSNMYYVKSARSVVETTEPAGEALSQRRWCRISTPTGEVPIIHRRWYKWTRPRGTSDGPAAPAPGQSSRSNLIAPYGQREWPEPYLDLSDGEVECSYWEAPYLEDLDPDDATRLEFLRPVVLDLKLRVLRRIAKALRQRDVRSLWDDVLRLVTDALPADDAAFCLRMDRFFDGYDLRTGETSDDGNWNLLPGGLTALLEVVGHCEKELTVGTMDRTKRALPLDALSDDVRSYYQAVGHPWRADLDQALDTFLELDALEPDFWAEFRARVNTAIENEFFAEVVVRTRVKQTLAAVFEPHVRTFVDLQRAHLESLGTLPDLQIVQPAPSTNDERNVFRHDGTHWTLTYGGKTVHVKDLKGMRLIAYLLRHKGREFRALELAAILDGGVTAPYEVSGSLGVTALDELGLRVDEGTRGEPILDTYAKSDLRRSLDLLREDLDAAKDLGDMDRTVALESKIHYIERVLAGAVGLGGRDRMTTTSAELARTRVRKLIEGARRQIAEHHPVLGEHLRAIRTGAFCSYSPGSTDDPPWET